MKTVIGRTFARTMAVSVVAASALPATAVVASASGCVTAGGTGMTAKVVVSSATKVSGAVNATGCDIGIYVGPGARGAVIDHARVSGANDHGILVQDVSHVVVRDSVIRGNGLHPHNVPGTSTPLSEDKAVTLLGTSHVLVEDNVVKDNVGDGGISVNDDGNKPSQSVLSTGAARPAFANVVRDNVVRGNLVGCAIVLSAWNPAEGVVANLVVGNTVTGRVGSKVVGSIVVAADPPGTKAINNVVLRNTVTASMTAGIIVHSNAPGDRVAGTKIVNNRLRNNDWSRTDGPPKMVGIVIASLAAGAPTPSVLTNTIVARNRIRDEEIGIWISGATRTHISGLRFNHATIRVVRVS